MASWPGYLTRCIHIAISLVRNASRTFPSTIHRLVPLFRHMARLPADHLELSKVSSPSSAPSICTCVLTHLAVSSTCPKLPQGALTLLSCPHRFPGRPLYSFIQSHHQFLLEGRSGRWDWWCPSRCQCTHGSSINNIPFRILTDGIYGVIGLRAARPLCRTGRVRRDFQVTDIGLYDPHL